MRNWLKSEQINFSGRYNLPARYMIQIMRGLRMAGRVLELNKISMSFPGVKALDDVNFKADGGKINCLVGENGAGKSTLIKILAGIYRKDEGEIILNGEQISIHSLQDAKKNRINFIFQDTNLCDKLTVFENYTLGKEKAPFGIIDQKSCYEKARSDFEELGVDIDLDQPMSELSVAEKQIIEIIKAFDEESEVIVYDEPSSALTEIETKKLFSVINTLKSEGVIVIYISHRLEEIFEIGDYVTVLRNGKKIGDRYNVKELNKARLIDLIVGEENFKEHEKKEYIEYEDSILVVDNLTTRYLSNISFNLGRGEILGITGLLGSGYDRLARTLYGLEKITSGKINYNGREYKSASPQTMVKNGVGYIPENRREEAIFGVLNIMENLTISSTAKFSSKGIINFKKEREITDAYVDKLEVKTPDIFKKIQNLSGGNQQKVVISRWLAAEAELLLLVEPTHGIDVKTKIEIYDILKDISKSGISTIIFSTEYAELESLCSRILIMERCRIKKVLTGDDVNQQTMMNNM